MEDELWVLEVWWRVSVGMGEGGEGWGWEFKGEIEWSKVLEDEW